MSLAVGAAIHCFHHPWKSIIDQVCKSGVTKPNLNFLCCIRVKCFAKKITINSSHGRGYSVLPQPIQGFESTVLYFANKDAPLMFKLHFGWGVVVSVWGICVQSQAALDRAKIKQTSEWRCDMFCEHRPTANYTSQDNCSIYSPKLCCCFLPVEFHSRT